MHSIRAKILSLTILPLFLTLVLLGSLAIINKFENEQELISNRLVSFRSLLETGDLSFESLRNKEKIEILLDERVEYAEIVRADHSVLYSTSLNTFDLEHSESTVALIEEAFSGVETLRVVTDEGKRILEYTSPIIINDRIVAVLRFEVANERSMERVLSFTSIVIVIGIISVVLSYFLIALLLSRTVLSQIAKLKAATTGIERGDLESPILSSSSDEIGELAKTLEAMRKEVKSSREKLVVANMDLEAQVGERTVELQSKLRELERLNSFMVDREVKMVALKQRIDELERLVAAGRSM